VGSSLTTSLDQETVGEEIAETRTMMRLSFGELDRRIRS
jgi:hypothetical protein